MKIDARAPLVLLAIAATGPALAGPVLRGHVCDYGAPASTVAWAKSARPPCAKGVPGVKVSFLVDSVLREAGVTDGDGAYEIKLAKPVRLPLDVWFTKSEWDENPSRLTVVQLETDQDDVRLVKRGMSKQYYQIVGENVVGETDPDARRAGLLLVSSLGPAEREQVKGTLTAAAPPSTLASLQKYETVQDSVATLRSALAQRGFSTVQAGITNPEAGTASVYGSVKSMDELHKIEDLTAKAEGISVKSLVVVKSPVRP